MLGVRRRETTTTEGAKCASARAAIASSHAPAGSETRSCEGALPKTVDAKALLWLKQKKVSGKVVAVLRMCTFTAPLQIGRLTLFPLAMLPEKNRGKRDGQAIKNGFLIIGEGPTGDPVAIELSNGQVAFLSHDSLWGRDPDCVGMEECIARSTLGIDDFFALASTDSSFPADFYAAGGS